MTSPSIHRSAALSDQLNTVLASQIVSGERPAGSRLPTEAQLADEFQVSRTVVREAIARLRSDGLVVTRQGLGAFVADSLEGLPFRIESQPGEAKRNVRELFEFRLGIEAEAAALAAERALPPQLEALAGSLHAMVSAIRDGRDGVEEDFQFHRAIAMATNNAMYRNFLAFLERHLRQQIVVTRRNTAAAGRTEEVVAEHRAIYEAIARGDADAARDAARRHLQHGIERLVTLGAH